MKIGRTILLLSALLAFSCTREEIGDVSREGGSITFSVNRVGEPATKADAFMDEMPLGLCQGDTLYLNATVADMPLPETLTKGTPYTHENDLTDTVLGLVAYTYTSQGESNPANKTLYDGAWPVQASYSGGKWVPARTITWPGSNYIQFFSWAPYSAASCTPATVSDPILAYEMPANPAEASQHGLLVASKENPGRPSLQEYRVKLDYEHALCGIRFVTAGGHTISSISLSGFYDKGNYNMRTGAWSGQDKISPDRTYTLTAPTTDPSFILMMVPQTTPSSAQISVTMDGGGSNEFTFTIPMDGKTLTKGKLVTYTISYEYVMEATAPTDLYFYGGTSTGTTVSSYRLRNGVHTDIGWTVQGYYPTEADAEAKTNAIGSPYVTAPTAGTSFAAGTGSLSLTYNGASPGEWINMESTVNSALSGAEVKGSSSSYWNLANPSNGTSDAIKETANCYIINAPGYYRIPLVVGNGIKDGTLNSAAYNQTNYLDYKGQRITSPYLQKTNSIYLNSPGTPSSAYVVWEDQKILDVVNESGWVLDPDGASVITSTGSGTNVVYWVNFHVDASKIKQGNAVIAVTDGSSNVMWSWHLWFTDYVPNGSADIRVVPNSTYKPSGDYYVSMMPMDLGWYREAYLDYATTTVYVRLEQTSPGNKHCIAEVTRPEYKGVTKGHAPYYQWGRKDAFHYSTGGSDNPPRYGKVNAFTKSQSAVTIAVSIMNPGTFYYGSNGSSSIYNWRSTQSPGLWYAGNTSYTPSTSTAAVVKSIYDPCPAGYHVPSAGAFTGFTTTTTGSYYSNSAAWNIIGRDHPEIGPWTNGYLFWSDATTPNSDPIFFPAGLRISGANGSREGSSAYVWGAEPHTGGSNREGWGFEIHNGQVYPLWHHMRAHGSFVRPVQD